jgi:hypothetical protein
MKYYVYKLVDLNGNCFYVGKGTHKNRDRIWWHYNCWQFSKNKKYINKITKLRGIFKHEIIFESNDENECFDKEKEFIAYYGRDKLCNLTDGGEGTSGRIYTHSIKTRLLLSKALKNSIKARTARINNSRKAALVNTGKRKIDILDSKLKTFILENHMYMTVPDLSDVVKISQYSIRRWLKELNVYHLTLKTKPRMPETNLKVSKSMKGKYGRNVEMYDLNSNYVNTFNTITEACDYLGLSRSAIGSIVAVCKGIQKTAYGYTWKYKN